MSTITVDRAVLEQVLEALEQSETLVPYEGFGMLRREAERKHEAAIAALKAALAQQEQDWSMLQATQESLREHMSEINRLRAALAQQEQEPVAWMFQHKDTGRKTYVSNDGGTGLGRFLVMNPRYALVGALYTTPPRREWQSLTEGEIKNLPLYNNPSSQAVEYARAVELALKEKNEL